jgi:hypothetical protein
VVVHDQDPRSHAEQFPPGSSHRHQGWPRRSRRRPSASA